MLQSYQKEIGLAAAWLLFPLIPVVLEDLYYQTWNLGASWQSAPDPREWRWTDWLVMLGPLVGFSFLAGATQKIPDDLGSSRGKLSRLFARRWVWVAVGPWAGLLLVMGCYLAMELAYRWLPSAPPPDSAEHAPESWTHWIASWAFIITVLGILAYGWLWPAWAAIRRAARIRQAGDAIYRGLVTAIAFLGSLFGGFWAATSIWRSYFFDSRLVPLIAAAISLAALGGCASPMTYGQQRRRELFHAMLLAWVFGLALMWRWWSRPRGGRPHN
jgi:hypothetical protein